MPAIAAINAERQHGQRERLKVLVKELIEKLRKENPDALVLLPALSRPNETTYFFNIWVSYWDKETKDKFVIIKSKDNLGINSDLLDAGWILSK